jgi:hypothetical protein
MNERIRELAQQAGAQGIVNRDFVDIEKFAELIVRECANIVQDSPWQLPQKYKSVDQANLIKKYFGVSE